MVEPPYGVIWNRLRDGNVVPFLGAGASLAELAADATWGSEEPTRLPRARELAEILASDASYPAATAADLEDLAKVCSYYVDMGGRKDLRARLRDVFNRTYQPGTLHQLLARVVVPLTVVTTNYDMLLEQTFKACGKPFDLVIYPTDRKDLANAVLWWPHGADRPQARAPNELDIDLANTTVIYKMHGTVVHDNSDWDSFVITEEDYVEFLSRMTTNAAIPSLFVEYFAKRSFLFLGYSLRDWNLRVVLKNIQHLHSRAGTYEDDEGPLPSWAIQHEPSELDKRLWENRRVSIFDAKLTDFVTKLEERRGSAQRLAR